MVDRDHTYSAQHVAMLDGQADACCSLEDGLEVLRTIAAIETAGRERRWVDRQEAIA